MHLLLLPLALQPAAGFGLSNNTSPFVPIYHQLSPSSHSQRLKISFHFFSPSFPGSSSSSRLFQFLSEGLFGHPILLHSLQVTQPTYPSPLYPFYYIFSFPIVHQLVKKLWYLLEKFNFLLVSVHSKVVYVELISYDPRAFIQTWCLRKSCRSPEIDISHSTGVLGVRIGLTGSKTLKKWPYIS